MLGCVSVFLLLLQEGHKPQGLFKKKYKIFNRAYSYWLGLFYGHVPERYCVCVCVCVCVRAS